MVLILLVSYYSNSVYFLICHRARCYDSNEQIEKNMTKPKLLQRALLLLLLLVGVAAAAVAAAAVAAAGWCCCCWLVLLLVGVTAAGWCCCCLLQQRHTLAALKNDRRRQHQL